VGIVEDATASADWIASALTSSGYRADFSPGSLWEIERFFDEHAPSGRARPGGLLAENLGSRIFALGSYVGEVLRRSLGGEWVGDDADAAAEINLTLLFPDGGQIWPVQRAMKRLKNGPEDNIATYGVALGAEVGPKPNDQPR
jgi:hypothetical protein